jgi:PLP dependent protein
MTDYIKVLNEVKSLNSNVTLLAVSKTKPYESILEAYSDGCRLFGENRVQETAEKFPLIRPEGMKVYLIGQLQRNKVRKAVRIVDRIESVDSTLLLEKIDAECAEIGKVMDILFEVNSSGEEQKSGFRTKEELFDAVEKAEELRNVRLLGLMTVGPLGCDRDKNRKAFTYTRELFDEIGRDYPLSVLSMGMSADWRDAVECGSTEVRIGSAIFGARDYTK